MAWTPDEGVIAPHASGPRPRRPAPCHPGGHRDLDPAIAQRAQGHPDFPLFEALPGAGAVFAPRLLVAFGAQRARFTSADALQQDAGIAPVTERRGKTSWVPGASNVRRASAKRSWSGRRSPSGMLSGHRSLPSRNATKAKPTRPPCGPSRSHGSVSFLGVGKSTRRTMRPPLSRHSRAVAHRCSTILRRYRETP